MALRQTLPRAQWKPAHFYNLNKQNKAKRLSTVKRYPDGAILHWDANADTYDSNYLTELTGGPHTFNHAVLSPQYQRNADGLYVNVGAKPAVDVFGGEKWLRSCGAVTNLLPRGDLTDWGKVAVTVSNEGLGVYRLTRVEGLGGYVNLVVNRIANQVYYHRVIAKAGGSGSAVILSTADDTTNFNLSSGVITIGTGSITHIGDGWYLCEAFKSRDVSGDATFRIWIDSGDIIVKEPQLTATSYPVPYTPPGTTMPASNATTTNGMWFSLPDGSPLWQALTGQPLTLATRVRMGVGSGDLPNGTYQHFASAVPTNTTIVQHSYIFSNGIQGIVRSTDGSGTYPPELYLPWPRNAIIRRVTQVSADGTKYRVGYMIEGTHAAIQWSEWANYDGSFGPSTLYRLMLGYLNAYPMWFNKITAWKKQATDAEILEAMA